MNEQACGAIVRGVRDTRLRLHRAGELSVRRLGEDDVLARVRLDVSAREAKFTEFCYPLRNSTCSVSVYSRLPCDGMGSE